MTVKAVFFDIGETLVDETSVWDGWADWLKVPRFTFHATLGTILAREGNHLEVFRTFAPSVSLSELLAQREVAQPDFGFTAEDFYPDALPTLQQLKADGFKIGIAGNQPARATNVLADSLPHDWLVISELAGVEKPFLNFFAYLIELTGLSPSEVAYVGDRIDNDILPARGAGLVAIHLRRGPWGYLHSQYPEAQRASLHIDSLTELLSQLTLGL